MKIEIDEEVYAALKDKAIPFEDKTPNDVIRRLLGFDDAPAPLLIKSPPQRVPRKVADRRKPKADLNELVNAGVLKEGQILHLRNYQRVKFPDSEATIHQGALLRDEITNSMSNLALKLFEEKGGYKPNSVSGPVYWYTEDNISIKNLWDEYLEKNGWNYNS